MTETSSTTTASAQHQKKPANHPDDTQNDFLWVSLQYELEGCTARASVMPKFPALASLCFDNCSRFRAQLRRIDPNDTVCDADIWHLISYLRRTSMSDLSQRQRDHHVYEDVCKLVVVLVDTLWPNKSHALLRLVRDLIISPGVFCEYKRSMLNHLRVVYFPKLPEPTCWKSKLTTDG